MTDQDGQEALKHCARTLLDQLEGGASNDALKTISMLNEQRDNMLFEEIGKLTRSLHESIKNFALDTCNHEMQDEMSRMQDASQRLQYVIEKTEVAANRTMDLCEATIPVSVQLKDQAQHIQEKWDRLMRKELTPTEFRSLSKEVGDFLQVAARDTGTIQVSMNDILLAQDYQDLTGQVIKRVIELVSEVEDSLVGLVRMASTVDQLTGIKHEDLPILDKIDQSKPEGPIINPEERADVVSNQDDVDALLSSLGF